MNTQPEDRTMHTLLGCVAGAALLCLSSAQAIAQPETTATRSSAAWVDLGPWQSDESEQPHQTAAGAAKSASAPIFNDRFEPGYSEPPLAGTIRFSNKGFSATNPGTQLASLSGKMVNDLNEDFLHVDTSVLGRVWPSPQNFTNLSQFALLRYTAGGVVEAALAPVDLSLNNPDASTSGCETADFDTFPAGRIALVQRGGCTFLQKLTNAEAAGAVAMIVFNQGTTDRVGMFRGTLRANSDTYAGRIPAVSTSFELGAAWARSSGAIFRLRADVGAQSNIWELKPVVLTGSNRKAYWIRNTVTGEVLYPGPLSVANGAATRIEVGQRAATDQSGQWLVEDAAGGAKRLKNLRTGEYLASIVSGINAQLVSAPNATLRDASSICAGDPSCDQWAISQPFNRPPVGTTRIRSALGEGFLQIAQDQAQVSGIKQGWASANWVLEVVPNTSSRRLLNVSTGDYLHVENGILEAGSIEPGWQSAMWDVETVSSVSEVNGPGDGATLPMGSPASVFGYVRFRNNWTGALLTAEGALATASNVDEQRLAAIWSLDDEPITVADAQLRAIANAYLGQSANAEILSSEAAGLYTLWAGDSGVASLEGLQYFNNLRDLRVARNSIVDVGPLRELVDLEYLDLSGNTQLANIDPLLANTGLDDGDRVIMLEIGQLPRDSGEGLTGRGVILIPAPGYFTLHLNQVELADQTRFRRVEEVTNNANWDVKYDPAKDWYYLVNRDYGRERILYWPEADQGSRFEFRDFVSAEGDSNAGWQFEYMGAANQYRLFNERTDTSMQTCFGRLGLLTQDSNNNQCPPTIFYVPTELIFAAEERALATYWDPNFAAPPNGFTRIQNVDTREYLHAETQVTPEVGEVSEGWWSAQWKMVPFRASGYTYHLIQNRWTNQYLRIDGASGAAVSNISVPTDPLEFLRRFDEFAQYLFVMDGSDEVFVIRSVVNNRALRFKNDQLSFADGLIDRSMIWRLDGGLDEPTGFLEVRMSDAAVGTLLPELTVSWKEPQGGGVTRFRSTNTPSYYPMPADAFDIRVLVTCIGFPDCSLTFEREVLVDRTFDRPPDRCLEIEIGTSFTGGTAITKSCTPAASGPLYDFALQNLQDVTCEFNVFTDALEDIFESVPVEDVALALVDGRFTRASNLLFDNNAGTMDFSACSGDRFKTVTFGAGAEAGFFSYDAGGEIGLAWSPDGSGTVRSYTSTGESFGASSRIISAGITASVGAMIGEPEDFQGRAVGIFMGAAIPLPIDAVPPGATVAVEGGISLWFTCDTGVGAEFSETQDLPCDLREDSTLEGFSFDFGIGAEISTPSSGSSLSGVYTQRCVPANFSQTSGTCSQ